MHVELIIFVEFQSFDLFVLYVRSELSFCVVRTSFAQKYAEKQASCQAQDFIYLLNVMARENVRFVFIHAELFERGKVHKLLSPIIFKNKTF